MSAITLLKKKNFTSYSTANVSSDDDINTFFQSNR